jgi:hypothetical protein
MRSMVVCGPLEPGRTTLHMGSKGRRLRFEPAHCHWKDRNIMKLTESKLTDMMNDADFVVIDGIMFQTGYLRVPDEFTSADDVVLEARRGDTEVDLTRGEIDDAVLLGEGVFRLKSGSTVRFLTSAVIH